MKHILTILTLAFALFALDAQEAHPHYERDFEDAEEIYKERVSLIDDNDENARVIAATFDPLDEPYEATKIEESKNWIVYKISMARDAAMQFLREIKKNDFAYTYCAGNKDKSEILVGFCSVQ